MSSAVHADLVLDSASTVSTAPASPLSDYPDNLSDCSEARAKQHTVQGIKSIQDGHFLGEECTASPIQDDALAKTPETSNNTVERALPTPPRSLARIPKASQPLANEGSISPSMLVQARSSQDGTISAHSRRTIYEHTTQSVLAPTRRSIRIKRPPTKYIPPLPTQKKAQKCSLTVQLRLKSEHLARLSKIMDVSQYPRKKGAAKRKLDHPTAPRDLEHMSTPEEPLSQRPRLEIPSELLSSSMTWPDVYNQESYPHTEQYSQPIMQPASFMPWDPQHSYFAMESDPRGNVQVFNGPVSQQQMVLPPPIQQFQQNSDTPQPSQRSQVQAKLTTYMQQRKNPSDKV
jgi:hypothetical protein